MQKPFSHIIVTSWAWLSLINSPSLQRHCATARETILNSCTLLASTRPLRGLQALCWFSEESCEHLYVPRNVSKCFCLFQQKDLCILACMLLKFIFQIKNKDKLRISFDKLFQSLTSFTTECLVVCIWNCDKWGIIWNYFSVISFGPVSICHNQ